MKQFIAIALFRGRGGRLCQRVLCAILALLLVSTSVFAQEPELLSPEEAKAVYEELTADCVAVEDGSAEQVSAAMPFAGMKQVFAAPAMDVEPELVSEPESVAKSVTEPELSKVSDSEPMITADSVAEPEPELVTEKKSETVVETKQEKVAATESESAMASESVAEYEPEPELVSESDSEPVTEPEPELVAEYEPEPEPVACDTPEPQKIVTSTSSASCSEAKPISPKTEEESEEPIPYVEENEDDDDFGEEDEEGNILTADTVATDEGKTESNNIKSGKIDTPSSQVIRYAKRFWDEAEEQYDKHNIDISGTKTFELKKAKVSGDVSHFSTEHYDCYPGSKLTQSLHLEIDGNIDAYSTVHAVLDDSEDEDRKFTVNIDSNGWKIVLGDFPVSLEGTKFALYSKEVRGVMAQGYINRHWRSTFLYAQSKGLSRRERFRGAGAQQEYRMLSAPIVQESEKVYIDGVQLVRGTDYQVDYEDGVIKFLPAVLPIEVTHWVVVEYESDDEENAYTRNMFGTRQEYIYQEGRSIGFTWIKELDHSSPKSSADVDNASSTINPMSHDIYEADVNWRLGRGFSVNGEYAMSVYDPNRKSNETESDKSITGHAASFTLNGKNEKVDASASYDQVDSKFKIIGREDGVIELGERGLVDDIVSGKAKFNYKFDSRWSSFADGEKSKTNLDDDPSESKIDFEEFNGGFIWEKDEANRFEVRGGRQIDEEHGIDVDSNMTKDTSALVFDRTFGSVRTQTKAERTAYKDDINVASDSEVLEIDFSMGSEVNENFSWNMGASRIIIDDEIVLDGHRSETSNYELSLNYEPSRKFNAKGEFQFRREDDYYNNSRSDSKLADSQVTYEPNDDFRTTFKYKVENTSKIVRDDTLDRTKYILPSSLPEKDIDEYNTTRYEDPVEKITLNSTTDYKISKNLSAYVDWRRRDVNNKLTGKQVSKTDRSTYELRYNPIENLSFTTEYENGYSCNNDSPSELKDWLKSFQLRYEFCRGYVLDATYEEINEDDTYDDKEDELKKTKILELQRPINKIVTLEFGLQHDDILSYQPSKEFDKRFAVTVTPSSKNQRYKFFLSHKDIDAEIKGKYYEGGVTFSQFIGTDTMIDGEIKKIHSSKTLDGDGYDAVVCNAKVVITF